MFAQERRNHFQKLIIVLSIFIVLQTIMGVLGQERAFQYYVRIYLLIEINIILTTSLSFINGHTGQFSLGHAGFMAIGAYSSVMITTVLPRMIMGSALNTSSVGSHVIFICSIFIGGGIAGLFGFIIGFPSLRLRGDYLAIVTLAAGEVIRALLRFSDFMGGPRGIPGIPKFAGCVYIGLFFMLSLWIMRNIVFSHFSRGYIAVRDNEIAASSMGINTTYQKVSAFIAGAFFAGIAGGLFAHMSQYINPDNFGFLKTLDILIFLYVGGSQTLAGCIVGAGLFTLVPEGLRLVNIENWRMVIYPLILIVVMRFRMNGIMGNREFGFLTPWKYKEMLLKRGKP
jgi:ABC-type branched-chain amino acid transport system, permease component